MGSKYQAKQRKHSPAPSIGTPRSEQERQCREAQAAREGFRQQNLPEVKIRDGRAFCPYTNCGYEQKGITKIGINRCCNGRCEREFTVPDTPEMKSLIEGLSYTAIRRERKRQEGFSQFYRGSYL